MWFERQEVSVGPALVSDLHCSKPEWEGEMRIIVMGIDSRNYYGQRCGTEARFI
jgi:hypothetical protein